MQESKNKSSEQKSDPRLPKEGIALKTNNPQQLGLLLVAEDDFGNTQVQVDLDELEGKSMIILSIHGRILHWSDDHFTYTNNPDRWGGIFWLLLKPFYYIMHLWASLKFFKEFHDNGFVKGEHTHYFETEEEVMAFIDSLNVGVEKWKVFKEEKAKKLARAARRKT